MVHFCHNSSKSIPDQAGHAAAQERVRKDVECAFGILVQRFHVPTKAFRKWHMEDLCDLVKCCTILHNAILEESLGDLLSPEEEEEDIRIAMSFPLFGRPRITAEEAANEGVDLIVCHKGCCF